MDITGDTCRNGHPWSAENTRVDTQGYRTCGECRKDATRRYKARLGAASRPPQERDSVEHRPVLGFEDLYEVTADGRVWSLRRRRYMAPSTLNRGHKAVSLTRAGKRVRTALVHHLVLEAFVGPRPVGMDGCHNDGDPANNGVDNLRWDTPSGNMRDKRIHGTDHNLAKTHCPQGHPYAGENLIRDKKGRICRACRNARAASRPASTE